MRHIAVVGVFGLMGTSLMADALRPYPRMNTSTWPYQGIELDILEGIAFLLATYGVYRFNSKLRYPALFLAGVSIFIGAMSLFEARLITTLVWLIVWLLVLWWFFTPAVRYQFKEAGKHARAS